MTLSKEKLVALYSLYNKGHYEEVIQQGNTLIAQFSNDFTLINILGVSNIALGRFDLAIEHYKKAISLNPSSAELYNNIGAAYKEKGDFDEAIEAFQKAINLKPNYAEALLNHGTVLQENGDNVEAVNSYLRSLRITPDNVTVLNNLGTALKTEKRFSAAIKYLQLAIKLKPDHAQAHNNLGTALSDQGYHDAGIESIKRSLKLQPNSAISHVNLGISLTRKNYLTEAIESYQRAIELKSDVPAWHCLLGNLLDKNGESEAAFKCMQLAIKIDPNLPDSHLSIGNMYLKYQEYNDALNEFDIAGSEKSFEGSLMCLHALGRHDEFTDRIRSNIGLYKFNIKVAAICAFVFNQINKENVHPFCQHPLDFIYTSNLNNHEKNTAEFIEDLLNELKQEPTAWSSPINATVNGFHTTTNLFHDGHGKILRLEEIIENEIKLYYSKYKLNKCEFINSWPIKSSLYGWSVRIHKDGYQQPHIHTSGWLSGVIYLKLVKSENKDEGAIEFSLLGDDLVVINENIPKFRFYPIPGDIVLFPSSLYHYTIPIKKEGERVIVSFDLVPKESRIS